MNENETTFGVISDCFLGYGSHDDDDIIGLFIQFDCESGFCSYFYPEGGELVDKIKVILKKAKTTRIDLLIDMDVEVKLCATHGYVEDWEFFNEYE